MSTSESRRRDWPTLIGLAVIGAVAVAWSFTALSDLAYILGITAEIPLRWGDDPRAGALPVAWGLPVTLDVLALVATRVWLQGRVSRRAVRYARRTAWAAIIASVGGNAYHGWLTGHGRVDVVIVSAVPAVAVGVVVHLAVQAGLPAGEEESDRAGRPSLWVRGRTTVAAWWEARKALRVKRGKPRAAAGETGRAAGEPTIPTGADSNDVLAADLRRLNADRRAGGDDPLGRDAVRERYRIGSGRADTVRALAEQPPSPARPRLVHDDGEEAVG